MNKHTNRDRPSLFRFVSFLDGINAVNRAAQNDNVADHEVILDMNPILLGIAIAVPIASAIFFVALRTNCALRSEFNMIKKYEEVFVVESERDRRYI